MCMDCVLFDFATKNLHLATIFYLLVDKCDLRILLISSPDTLYVLLHEYTFNETGHGISWFPRS